MFYYSRYCQLLFEAEEHLGVILLYSEWNDET